MSTAAQFLANQQNAQQSTGPRTEAGKQASAQNARTHGLTVSDKTLAQQWEEEIRRLTEKYAKAYPSSTPEHSHLCRTLACAIVRQRVMEQAVCELLPTCDIADKSLALAERYRAAAERSFYRALKALQTLAAQHPAPKPEPLPAPKPDPNKTNPTRPTLAELKQRFPTKDRNELTRMAAGILPIPC